MQNLMLNRLAPISIPKNEKLVCSQKARMFFSNRPFWFWEQFNPYRPNPGQSEKIKLNFYFHTSLWCLKIVFPLFRAILDSWEISSKSVWSRKINLFRQNIFLFSNLLPRVPSFYVRRKSRLKNRVTIVHLLQCNTNLFIRL